MRKQVLLMSISMLLLAACTDPNVKPPAEMIPDEQLQKMEDDYNASVDQPYEEVVCEKETVIGSRFKEVRCRTKTHANQERMEARRFLERRKSIPLNGSQP